jgi:hypothetical protein
VIRPPDLVRFLIDVTSIGDLLRVVDDDPGIDESLPDGPLPDDGRPDDGRPDDSPGPAA